MTYAVISLICVVVACVAVYMLFKRELPPPEQLRVDWPDRTRSSAQTRMRFRGPDRFCPSCGRWLVKVKEDGTFDIAAMAGLTAEGEMTLEVGQKPPDTMEALVVEATCLICNPEE